MQLLQKGIILEQNKEPAFSRDIFEFLNSGNPIKYFETSDTINDTQYLPSKIIEIAQSANIYDEIDGIMLYKKLSMARNKSIITIIADAIDDEPYISSQMGPAMKFSEQLVGGMQYAQTAIGAKKKYIAFYKNLGEINTKIPLRIEDIDVRFIIGRYPAEHMIKRKLNEKSAIVIGVGALIHLYRACKFKRIQTTSFITVAGNAVATPCNMEVSLGMTVTQILEKCGLPLEPTRISIGGSMTGIGVIDTDKTTITPITKAVLAFRNKYDNNDYSCIGCGKCSKNCPMGLSPYYIYKYIKSNQTDKLDMFDYTSCIGCGVCSYGCPSKIDIGSLIYQYASEARNNK